MARARGRAAGAWLACGRLAHRAARRRRPGRRGGGRHAVRRGDVGRGRGGRPEAVVRGEVAAALARDVGDRAAQRATGPPALTPPWPRGALERDDPGRARGAPAPGRRRGVVAVLSRTLRRGAGPLARHAAIAWDGRAWRGEPSPRRPARRGRRTARTARRERARRSSPVARPTRRCSTDRAAAASRPRFAGCSRATGRRAAPRGGRGLGSVAGGARGVAAVALPDAAGARRPGLRGR